MNYLKIWNTDYFKKGIDSDVLSETQPPQLGFCVSYDRSTCELQAKVIGARYLPTEFGSSAPRGYLVKVRNAKKYDNKLK